MVHLNSLAFMEMLLQRTDLDQHYEGHPDSKALLPSYSDDYAVRLTQIMKDIPIPGYVTFLHILI